MTTLPTLTKAQGALSTERHTETNPAAVYLAALSANGRYTMMRTLDRIAADFGQSWDTMPWAQMRYEHVQAIRAQLAERYAPATVNLALCALRRVAQEAWKLGQMDAQRKERIASVPGVKGSRLPSGRAIGSGELAAMLGACAETPTAAGARDAAIIAVGYAAGLRRAELAGLTLADVTDKGDNIELAVRGKGNKERTAYLTNGAAAALRDWIRIRGDNAGPLFYRGRRGGHLVRGKGLTPQAIRDIILRRADQAKVRDVTPHDLRRSCVSDLLDAGVDIKTVADLVGHENVQTTARYDRRPEARKRKAADTLHVPYMGRTLAT
jgi:integrase